MKSLIAAGVLVASAALFAAPANAAGCLKGAVIGGAAGHFAGHHGLLGAGAGCLIGRHHANKQAQQTNSNNNGSSNNAAQNR